MRATGFALRRSGVASFCGNILLVLSHLDFLFTFGTLARDGLDPRQRFLLLANTLHGVDFTERQLEVEPEERLTQARRFGAQFVLAQLA
jgi:hypothetical protein